MAAHGRLNENDGQLTVMPSWFNNVFRQLKLLFRPGLACAESSALGRIHIDSSTRASVTMPTGDEFVFSGGQFMSEVHQDYVDWVDEVPDFYGIMLDAKVNNDVACPRFEIWTRKYRAGEGAALEDELQFATVGYLAWTGEALLPVPINEFKRRSLFGILPTANTHRGPLVVRENEQISLGDNVKIGPDAPADPNLLVSPANLQLVIGWMMRMFVGPNADWRFGRNGEFRFDEALLRLAGDSLLQLVNSTLDLQGSPAYLSGGAALRFRNWHHTGDWLANEMTVEDFPKVQARIAADGTLLEGRGVDHVEHNTSGVYYIYFSSPFANVNYRLHANLINPAEADMIDPIVPLEAAGGKNFCCIGTKNSSAPSQGVDADFAITIFGRMTSLPMAVPL